MGNDSGGGATLRGVAWWAGTEVVHAAGGASARSRRGACSRLSCWWGLRSPTYRPPCRTRTCRGP